MEALREEIQNMQAQLRDRERAALSANHRAAQLERQILPITEKAKEYQVAQIQLEALRLENKHLKELISGTQSSTSLILQPMGDRPVCDVPGDVTWDVSGDSGQWEEEEFQPGETGNSADSRRSMVGVPLSSSWEQTEPSDHPEARSPTPKPGDCYYSHGNSHSEEGFTAGPPSPLSSMVDRFLQEEEQRMLGLEQHFNSYVQELHGDTRRTLLKYSVRHPGNDTS
ncbi:hypothetical protein AGOR_G00129270 [Albula goreensis]|uniref:CEP63/Deup1 CEP152 binding coiled coil domain-containing protein n=1 Tax=Albula goreensis TaxID=1534307 RepID=A0A8T3D9L2_9TELE|nr:hypothetical protein AGOR_G00129270 [Albula goreensis]